MATIGDEPRDPGSRGWVAAAFAIGCLHALLAGHAAMVETPTVDECAHVPAGCAYWSQGALDLYAENPPLCKLWMTLPLAFDSNVRIPSVVEEPKGWGPWQFGARFQAANADAYLRLMARARGMVIPLTLATGWLIYLWAADLWGAGCGTMAFALYLLGPTALAHGRLATIDSATTLACLLTLSMLREALRRPTVGRFVLVGVAWGIALAIKFSALFLAPVFVIVALVESLSHRPLILADAFGKFASLMAKVIVAGLVAIVVIHASMSFQGSWERCDAIPFRSRLGRILNLLPAATPLPLPLDYMKGVDEQSYDMETGDLGTYFLGEWSHLGWKTYFPVAFAIKEPELFVLLAILAPFAWLRLWPGARETALLAGPIGVYLYLAMFVNTLGVGIRYLLPIYPFLTIAMAANFATLARRSQSLFGLGVAVLSASTIITIATTHPSYIGYFNPSSGGPSNGDRWLADSNLDWGQDLYRVPAIAAKRNASEPIVGLYFGAVEPTQYGIDWQPLPGQPTEAIVAVSANYYLGMLYGEISPDGDVTPIYRGDAAWTRPLAPVAKLGSIYIFDTRPIEPENLESAADWQNQGMRWYYRGDPSASIRYFEEALRRDPNLAEAEFGIGLAELARRRTAAAIDRLRAALRLRPKWNEPANELAWTLATSNDPAIYRPKEAIALAEDVCRRTEWQDASFLDTLAVALAADGRYAEAIAACRRAIEHAKRQGDAGLTEQLLRRLNLYEHGVRFRP